MDKNFSLYLTKLGFFDENTAKEIIKSNKLLENKKFSDSSFHYLMNFFENLNEEQKKYMSYFIPNNYKIITNKLRTRKIKSILIQTILRQKLKLLKKLYQWKNNIKINTYRNIINKYNIEENHKLSYDDNEKLSKNNTITLDDYLAKENINIYNNNINPNDKGISNIKSIYNYMNIKPHKSKNERAFNKQKNKLITKLYYNTNNNLRTYNYENNNNNKMRKPDLKYIYKNLYQRNISKKDNGKNKLLTSLESKELEDLKECTFKPRINNILISSMKQSRSQTKNKSRDNIESIFERLYKDEEKNKLSKELRTIDREYTIGKKFSFTPNINGKLKNIYRYQQHKNFAQRQREYMEKIDKKREDLRGKIDSEFDLICSFNPKITNEKGEYYIIKNKKKEKNMAKSLVFRRLYKDVEKRQELREQKEKENIDKFNEMANYLTLDKKVNDTSLIERLFDNRKEDIINKTREKVEKEEGITFQPDIGDNDYIQNINSNFMERNEDWIIRRNNFIEEENAKQLENLRNNGIGNKKKYTSEEREQIINNIIERLYENCKKNKNKSQEEEDNEEENEEENGEEENDEEEQNEEE
jgi:hypothetical protein